MVKRFNGCQCDRGLLLAELGANPAACGAPERLSRVLSRPVRPRRGEGDKKADRIS